jgi:hypothetical protein
MGFLEGDAQTPLVLLFAGIYGVLSYAAILAIDWAIRSLARSLRSGSRGGRPAR